VSKVLARKLQLKNKDSIGLVNIGLNYSIAHKYDENRRHNQKNVAFFSAWGFKKLTKKTK